MHHHGFWCFRGWWAAKNNNTNPRTTAKVRRILLIREGTKCMCVCVYVSMLWLFVTTHETNKRTQNQNTKKFRTLPFLLEGSFLFDTCTEGAPCYPK